MSTMKSNAAWDALCDLTTQIVEQARAADAPLTRVDGFARACAQRPDLARLARDPTGRPVVAGGGGAGDEPPAHEKESPLVKLAEARFGGGNK